MCGITGAFRAAGLASSHLTAMIASLTHRGPDASGRHELPYASIGVRRLSIVDPHGGQQPVQSADSRLIHSQNDILQLLMERDEAGRTPLDIAA